MTLTSDPSVDNPNNSEFGDPSATSRKEKWTPTAAAFDNFLKLLSSDRDEAARSYEILRTKLLRFFDWRGCDSSDLCTDETLDRAMRKLDEGEVLFNVNGYIHKIASLVYLEWRKEKSRTVMLEDDHSESLGVAPIEFVEDDPRVACFDRCLQELSQDQRNLILNYYQDQGRAKIELRQRLAAQLNVPLNALRIRAHRIRKALEQCIQACLALQA